MTKFEALRCIEEKDWMRARTVAPNRINAMFDLIKDDRKLIGRLLAVFYTYKYVFVCVHANDKEMILRRCQRLFNYLNNKGIFDLNTIDQLRSVSLAEITPYVTDATLKHWFEEEEADRNNDEERNLHAGWFNESLLLSKKEINDKIKELKSLFPEKFEGVEDDKIKNALKSIAIDYLNDCIYFTFKDTQDENKQNMLDLADNSKPILEAPEYQTLMSKFFEEVVDNWLEEHNLTHKDIVSFHFDLDTNQMFIQFDINKTDSHKDSNKYINNEPLDHEHDEIEEDELNESLDYDVLTRYEKSLYKKLNDNGIYPELYFENDDDEKLKLTLYVEGDWKHDHLYADKLVEEWADENGWLITYFNQEEIGESDSDDYNAIHYWEFKLNKDAVVEDIFKETYSKDELDKMIGKTYNQQKIQSIYRRQKYNDSRLFAHTRCVNCGREKRVFLSNLVNDPDKYGSCTCSDTNVESRLDNIKDLFDGTKKLSNNTSGYTGVSYIKTSKGKLYDKWRAYIEIDGKRTYLGDFNSKSAAIKARKKAAQKGIKWYKEHQNDFMKTYRKKSKRYRTTRGQRIHKN